MLGADTTERSVGFSGQSELFWAVGRFENAAVAVPVQIITGYQAAKCWFDNHVHLACDTSLKRIFFVETFLYAHLPQARAREPIDMRRVDEC